MLTSAIEMNTDVTGDPSRVEAGFPVGSTLSGSTLTALSNE